MSKDNDYEQQRLDARARLVAGFATLIFLVLGLALAIYRPLFWLRLNSAERQWQQHPVDSYTVEIVQDYHPVLLVFSLTVKDGTVISTDGDCFERIGCLGGHLVLVPEDFTVESLFDDLRKTAFYGQDGDLSFMSVTSSFDPTHGYPSVIRYGKSKTVRVIVEPMP